MANLVPIKNKVSIELLDAVLIDDDELIHMTWDIAAKNFNKKLKMYKTVAEFFAVCETFSTETPIYIDSNLGVDSKGGSIKGEEESKEIYAKGFENIYLCTGYPASDFKSQPHILGVVGKDPIWL